VSRGFIRAGMPSILPHVDALIVVLAVLVVTGSGAGYLHLKRKRRAELAAFAAQQGLQYSPGDPVGLVDPSFPLFQMGDGRGCENVLWGSWRGLPLAEGDYWYYTRDSRGGRTYHHYSVVVVTLEHDVFVPYVSITRQSLLTSIGDHLGLEGISFESEAFNRMFTVRAEEREFAFKLIDEQMMQWLLSTEVRLGYQVLGGKVLVYGHRLAPAALIPILGSAKAFHDHIPHLVWTEYAQYGKGLPPTPAGEPQ